MLKIAVALLFVALPVATLAAPAQAQAKAQTLGPSDLVTMVNNLRTSVGVAPLATDPTLTSVAQTWANNMASTDVLSHNPNLATQAPSGWTAIGENIADGFSLTAIYNALVASQPHYANMVDSAFNRTGVGVATDSSGQVWVAEDFGDYPPPPTPVMVFPTTGDLIFSSTQSFSWNAVPGAVYYDLTVGTTQGGIDEVDAGLLPSSQLSYSVPALPGGQPLWARVYTYVQSTWVWTDVSFSVVGPSPATFTAPTAGATKVNTSVPFTWDSVASAQYYWITIGTTEGGYDVAYTALLPPTQTSATMAALPSGETLWARIYTYMNGNWVHYGDVTFTAAAA